MNEKEYSVSEAVRRTGVPSHVLRYWEEELQITIQRSAQGYRIYTESDLELFTRVKLLKEKGIQLKAIRVLLGEQDDGQKYFQEQNLESQIREIVHTDKLYSEVKGTGTAAAERQMVEEVSGNCGYEEETAEEVYGIVLEERVPDNLRRFEMILKSVIEDVIVEQNERLEQSLREFLKDELDEWYMKYYDVVCREAAAASAPQKKSLWEWIRRK